MTNQLRIFVLLTLLSCCKNKQTTSEPTKDYNAVKQASSSMNEKKKIIDFLSDTSLSRWRVSHSDSTKYLCEIILRNEYVMYWFHGQCCYYFFTNKINDTTINLLWSYKPDCILNMDFLENSYGLKKFPKHGAVFASYYLKNDSTIKVKYYFEDWTKKINSIAGDSLFPTTFHLDKSSQVR